MGMREGIGNPGTNRAGRALGNEVVKLGAIDCGHDSWERKKEVNEHRLTLETHN